MSEVARTLGEFCILAIGTPMVFVLAWDMFRDMSR